jgi:hypothetical protein
MNKRDVVIFFIVCEFEIYWGPISIKRDGREKWLQENAFDFTEIIIQYLFLPVSSNADIDTV